MARPSPFRGFVDMTTEMERARRLGTTGQDTSRAGGEQTVAEAWVPAADIYSVGDDLVIRLDVPGVRSSQIEVTLSTRSSVFRPLRHVAASFAASLRALEVAIGVLVASWWVLLLAGAAIWLLRRRGARPAPAGGTGA